MPDAVGPSQRLAPKLTPREIQVLILIAEGLKGKEIAQRLGVKPGTVAFHKTRLYEKIGVTGAVGAVRFAIREGYIETRFAQFRVTLSTACYPWGASPKVASASSAPFPLVETSAACLKTLATSSPKTS